MAAKDLRWLKGESEAGELSNATTSRLCEYVIGIGNPPHCKTLGNSLVDAALERAHIYLWSTSDRQWMQDSAEDLIVDTGESSGPSKLDYEGLLNIRAVIDLYN